MGWCPRNAWFSAILISAGSIWYSAVAASPVDDALVALQTGNASQAVQLSTAALGGTALSSRDRARLLVNRGLAREILGERDSALIDFTQAIGSHALAPAEQVRALFDRGVTLDELSRTDDALGDYSAAIRLEPGFAAALNNRGNAYRRLGHLVEAAADYRASIAAGNPHTEFPNYGLGQIAEAQGDAVAAREFYREALAANAGFTLAAERLSVLGDGDADAIHLRPPGQSGRAPVLHLHLPARTVPNLKPALGSTAESRTVQLGAWRSQGEAANAWSRLGRASGSLLVGLAPQVIAVDLPGSGRYYRLRTQTADGSARSLCSALRARGTACMVVSD